VLSAPLDSNTYISALNFGGTPLQILNVARAGFIGLDVSDAPLEEFAGVLRDKFRWPEDEIADALQEIRSFANHVTPAEGLDEWWAGPSLGLRDAPGKGKTARRACSSYRPHVYAHAAS
jgi:hypothetical protein